MCHHRLFFETGSRGLLEWRDSNPRMPLPKNGALPLGDTPLNYIQILVSPVGIEPTYDRHERPVLTIKLWAQTIEALLA